jgi:hypothetical protein
VAILVVVVAALAVKVQAARWINTALAVWLCISAMIFPHFTSATQWHNVLVAAVIFSLSLIGNRRLSPTIQ